MIPGLDQCFINFSTAESPWGLLNRSPGTQPQRSLFGRCGVGQWWVFLTSSPAVMLLLIWGPHFENHWARHNLAERKRRDSRARHLAWNSGSATCQLCDFITFRNLSLKFLFCRKGVITVLCINCEDWMIAKMKCRVRQTLLGVL